VYSGRLKTAQSIASIQVNDDTTVSDVINAALDQFGLDPETQLAYRMIKVVVDKGNLSEDWDAMQMIRNSRNQTIHHLFYRYCY